MKTVILCGGLGTRLRSEVEYRPKPMIEIGDKPILWHIMKIYSHYGFNEFVLCLGYKGWIIKDYFLHYELRNNDVTVGIGKNEITVHSKSNESDWIVTLAETGENAQTGARVKRIEKYVDEDKFMLTYGDGVAGINIDKLLGFHNSQKKIGTITAVHPLPRFGKLVVRGDQVVDFNKHSYLEEGFIDGGFMVFNKPFFDYLKEDDSCVLEAEPLQNLAKHGELAAYEHEGFWQCVDTHRELESLVSLWNSRNPPWKVWSD